MDSFGLTSEGFDKVRIGFLARFVDLLRQHREAVGG